MENEKPLGGMGVVETNPDGTVRILCMECEEVIVPSVAREKLYHLVGFIAQHFEAEHPGWKDPYPRAS